ncbi:MAG: hypothetical protein R3321_00755 [Nitrososphaeraceae archaeon]|nr:hypothetical protein [Nitrososphaeraceae archaeon]
MGNQQMKSVVYMSYDINNKKYIGAQKEYSKDYLGSFSDRDFNPIGKHILYETNNWVLAQFVEHGYQKAWDCIYNQEFVNQRIFPIHLANSMEFPIDELNLTEEDLWDYYEGSFCEIYPIVRRTPNKDNSAFHTKNFKDTRVWNQPGYINPMKKPEIIDKFKKENLSQETILKRHLSLLGGRNPRALEVVTPFGTFPTKKEACKVLNISYYLLTKHINDESNTDYYLNDYLERE